MDFAKRDGTQNDRRDGNNFFVNFGTFGCTICNGLCLLAKYWYCNTNNFYSYQNL